MKETAAKGVAGGMCPILGAVPSVANKLHMADVEAWLRITSLLVGIAVGLVTIFMMLRPWLKERANRRPWDE